MRSDLELRLGAPADAACLAVLGSQTWLHTYARTGIRPSIARHVQEQLSPGAFRDQLERSDAFTLIALVDGHLVGYAIGELGKLAPVASPVSTHLDKLYVQEHFVGTGIGHSLLQHARAEATHRAGSSALWLTVNSENRPACAFYARQGFTDIGAVSFDLYGEAHENRILHVLDVSASG
ncbi:MAG TPA: GNAT family N-acetyltransferase [Steroidobacteraceae bacterium]|jgi:ribosomal protein S18 acetylase RimI-like enzyme|nr:GNAT family N-acetyltransferase [Steroidobacteraceae bacterium]